MSDYDFAGLVARMDERVNGIGGNKYTRSVIKAVLRDSGHGEMVAALKDIERGKQSLVDSELVEHFQAIARAALKKAGAR